MVATDDIRRAIRERDEERLLKFIENGAEKGMTSTDQSLLELFEADLIMGETFAHYAVDKEFAETHTGIGQNRG